MNAYKEEPEEALVALEKIAEEIPSGVSATGFSKIVKRFETCPKEIVHTIQNDIAFFLQQELKKFWLNFKVSQRLKSMTKPLTEEEEFFATSSSSEELLNETKAKYLKAWKTRLELRLTKSKEENADLQKMIESKTDLLQRQKDQIRTCDFVL